MAAKAPDTDDWISGLTFYELRHSAISTALHSTLPMTKDGMNLHTLASYAGHDVQTLQRYYAHVIARYRDTRPIDLETECKRARKQVKARPFVPDDKPPGPAARGAATEARSRPRSCQAGELCTPPSQADASNLTLPRESFVVPPTEIVRLGSSRSYSATRSLLLGSGCELGGARTPACRRGCRTSRSANRCVNQSRDNTGLNDAKGASTWDDAEETAGIAVFIPPCSRNLILRLYARASVPSERPTRLAGDNRSHGEQQCAGRSASSVRTAPLHGAVAQRRGRWLGPLAVGMASGASLPS